MTALAVQGLIAVPGLAALAGLLLRRQRAVSGLVAIAGALLVLLLAVVRLATTGLDTADRVGTVGPLPVGELQVPLFLLADRPAAWISVAVALVGLAVQVFSVWYLRDDPRYPVFAATVSLFLAAMFLLVQSDDLLLTLVGWEVMGWCSYLLIGHVSERESARRAATKAFLVTRVADIGFVLGVVILAVGAGTTDIGTVLEHWVGYAQSHVSSAVLVAGDPTLTVALVLLLVGIAGKSGLVPFHDWLPDAMEGPTPASALIHAATMVAAGTYVVARLDPLFAASIGARTLLGVLAAVTMVWAALLAFAQSDVKRLLAYSTLSQVAIMASALAFVVAGPGVAGSSESSGIALAHLFSHALFKALLFLAVGWLSVLAGGTAFVALRGRASGRGALLWSLGIGLASLAGVPPLVGFVSKEGVIAAAEEGTVDDPLLGWVLLAALLVTVLLTAAYCARAWFLLTTDLAGGLAEAEAEEGQEESEEEAAPAGDEAATGSHDGRPITLGAALTVSVLAVLTVLGGLLVVPVGGGLHLGLLVALVSLVLIAVAVLGVRALSVEGHDAADRLGPRVVELADRGFDVDRAYVGVARAVTAAGRLIVRLDRDVVDAYPRGLVVLAGWAGRVTSRAHRAVPSAGLVAVVAGVVAVAVAGVTVWR